VSAADLGAFLVERARAEGFDDAGLAPVDGPIDDAAHLEAAHAAGRFGPLDWMIRTLDQRKDVRARMPSAQSVLVVVLSYYAGDHRDHVDDATLKTGARVSRYAWGNDYHHIMRRKLRRLRKALLERAPHARVAPFNDVDAVCDRAWAQAAGLGFIGKSGMFIHKHLGTWTFLGGLITDLRLVNERPPRVPLSCGSCTACLSACPTGAIAPAFTVDARRCLTTWNVEQPLDARGGAADLVGHGWAVGCDVCQEVCPWNKFQRTTTEPRLFPLPGHAAFSPATAPTTVTGTPLARPGSAVLPALSARALGDPAWLTHLREELPRGDEGGEAVPQRAADAPGEVDGGVVEHAGVQVNVQERLHVAADDDGDHRR
jgi:epoxyqueuosine reductase